VTKHGKSLPKEVIDHWPEVFSEIKLNVVPLRYLHAIIVTFKDGKIWEIKMNEQGQKPDWDELEKNIQEMFRTYEESIENIDFRLDTEKVKKDVIKASQKFLKKKKL
jgi:hypothetical protein